MDVTTGQTLRITNKARPRRHVKASKTIPGWSNAIITMIKFKVSNERRRGTIANRNNIAAITNITDKTAKTLIVEYETCMYIVATAEREYRGGERPAHQT